MDNIMEGEAKYLHYQLDFENCFMEYNYTICESLEQVAGYLQLIDIDLDDTEKEASVTIKGIGMTRSAYKYFLKSIENLHQ